MMKSKYVALTVSTLLVSSVALEPASVMAAGKTIHWTQNTALVTMDPSIANDVASAQIITQAGQGLYRVGKDGKPALADAKAVKISDDGLTWTITLRSGLKWSNGEPVTAADYVYGWQRTVNPTVKSTSAGLMNTIVNAEAINKGEQADVSQLGVKALDDQTLEIKLTHPTPMLPTLMTDQAFYPQHQAFVEQKGDKYGTTAENSLSNGPYKLTVWNGSSTSYALVKNPNYVDAKKVKTNKITFQTTVEANASYNLYQSGKVDYTQLSATQVKASKKKADYKQIEAGRTQYLLLNVKKGILANQSARQAIQYAINKDTLATRILTGSATPSTTFTPAKVIKDPKTGKDFATAYQTPYTKYSVKKAKAAWAKAQQESGIKKATYTLLVDNDDTSKNVGQYLQSELEKNLAGLKVEIKAKTKAARIKDMLASNYDMVLVGWSGEADPANYVGLMKSGQTLAFGNWQSDEFDKLITDAQTTDVMDEKKRVADLGKADQILQREAPVVTLNYGSIPSLINQDIKGLQINANGSTFDFTQAVKK